MEVCDTKQYWRDFRVKQALIRLDMVDNVLLELSSQIAQLKAILVEAQEEPEETIVNIEDD